MTFNTTISKDNYKRCEFVLAYFINVSPFYLAQNKTNFYICIVIANEYFNKPFIQ